MSPEVAPETGDHGPRPPGWILCSFYIPSVAVLCAACVLALDLLWRFLETSDMIDRDSFLIHVTTLLLSMATVTAILLLVFLVFRAIFKLSLPNTADERTNRFKIACLVLVAYFAFLAAYLLIARQIGITNGELDPDFLGALFAYVFFAKWPLSSLLNPNGPPLQTPTSEGSPNSKGFV